MAQAADLPLDQDHYTIQLDFRYIGVAFVQHTVLVQYGMDAPILDEYLGFAISTYSNMLRAYWWGNDMDVWTTVGTRYDDIFDGNWHTLRTSWDGTTRATFVDDDVSQCQWISRPPLPLLDSSSTLADCAAQGVGDCFTD